MSPTAATAALDLIEHDDLAAARRVVGQESRALARLAEALTGRFVDATELLAATQGRIVLSGMGKSGHIANKIAATFASTGAPALFVHPAEASHGDLGMITGADTLLMLSNSGETPELADLVNYATRFSIPLVAVVGRAPSTLADAATVALVLPDEPEAGTLGLAPTTSTIMMLALGDALAGRPCWSARGSRTRTSSFTTRAASSAAGWSGSPTSCMRVRTCRSSPPMP